MPQSTSSASAPARRRHWGRELAVAAGLFAVAAAAVHVAGLLNDGPDGTVLAAASAAAPLVAAAVYVWWTLRRDRAAAAHSAAGPRTAFAPGAQAAPGATPSVPAATTLWRMRTTVRDAPGTLGAVCTALAGGRVDIVTLQTHPLADGTVDEFLLRAPSALPAAALARTVEDAGGTDTWLERADAHDLVDMPTRMLTLAIRTALDAAELPLVLRQLFGRCTVTTTPAGPSRAIDATGGPGASDGTGGRAADSASAPEGSRDSAVDGGRHGAHREPAPADSAGDGDSAPTVMRLRDPSGGVITLRRAHLPFTPTEFARARALVELNTRLGVRMPHRRDALTPAEDDTITLRRARPDDRAAALALHRRCSPATLGQRYHGPAADVDRYLEHLLSPRFGQSLAAETASGRLVALGHLLWDGDENEVALLVEDEWQHRGIGSALLRELVELAAEAGRESVYAVTRASNTGMTATMRALRLPLDYQVEDGTLVITATLPSAADGTPGSLPWTATDRPA